MQNLVILLLNSLNGIQIRKGVNEFYKCETENLMKTEFGENVLEYWKTTNGNYIVQLKQDDALEIDNNVENILPSHLHLVAFISSNVNEIWITSFEKSTDFTILTFIIQIPTLNI